MFSSTASRETRAPDLRAPLLGAVAWVSALGALHLPAWWTAALGVVVAAGLVWRRRRHLPVRTHATWAITGAGVAVLTLLRVGAHETSPVTALAREHAVVQLRLVTTSDPALREGRFASYVVLRARAETVVGRSVRHRVRAPVLVVAPASWRRVPLGSTLDVSGRLQPARTRDLTGVVSPRGPPEVIADPGPAFRVADDVRASIRGAVSHHGPGARALVPALVDGDDGGLPEKVVEDFRTAGLTHLLAVSGTKVL